MLKIVKLFLLSLALVASVLAQGPQAICSQNQIFTFILGLPSQCSTPLQQVIPFLGNTDLNTDEGRQMVAQVCTPGCIGAIVDYLRETCFDPIQAFDYQLWCYQTDDADIGPFCRYALSDIFNGQVFSNISAECLESEDVCSMRCNNALFALGSELGCCYQTFYNNTGYLSTLLARGFINQMQLSSLEALGNPAGNPWTVCETLPPNSCTANPAIDVVVVDETTVVTPMTQSTTEAPNVGGGDGNGSNGEAALETSKSVFIVSVLLTAIIMYMHD